MIMRHTFLLLLLTGCATNGLFDSNSNRAPMLEKSVLLISGEGGYRYYRIPTMVVTKKGTVLAFQEGRKKNWLDHGDIDLLMMRSTDGGETWSPNYILHEEGGDAPITIGNPCPIADRETGMVYLLFCRDNKAFFLMKSEDDGLTWTKPKEYTDSLSGFGYPVVQIATGPVHGIRMRSGRLVVPIWVCNKDRLKRGEKPVGRDFRSGAIYSDDDGDTWNAGELVPRDLSRSSENTIIERSDGSLLMNIRMGYHQRAESESFDGGETWSVPVWRYDLPGPNCQASLLRFSEDMILFVNPAVSSKKGVAHGQSRYKLTLRMSRDDGKTWPISRVIEDGYAGYSDLAVLDDGTILCLYERGEKDYREQIVIARLNLEWLIEEPTQAKN